MPAPISTTSTSGFCVYVVLVILELNGTNAVAIYDVPDKNAVILRFLIRNITINITFGAVQRVGNICYLTTLMHYRIIKSYIRQLFVKM